MPSRLVAARELSEYFRILSHQDRIRIIEELAQGECGVSAMADKLELPSSRISQHLSLMRMARIVSERREGRQHLYRLVQPILAEWIVEGLNFVEARDNSISKDVIKDARKLWKSHKRSANH